MSAYYETEDKLARTLLELRKCRETCDKLMHGDNHTELTNHSMNIQDTTHLDITTHDVIQDSTSQQEISSCIYPQNKQEITIDDKTCYDKVLADNAFIGSDINEVTTSVLPQDQPGVTSGCAAAGSSQLLITRNSSSGSSLSDIPIDESADLNSLSSLQDTGKMEMSSFAISGKVARFGNADTSCRYKSIYETVNHRSNSCKQSQEQTISLIKPETQYLQDETMTERYPPLSDPAPQNSTVVKKDSQSNSPNQDNSRSPDVRSSSAREERRKKMSADTARSSVAPLRDRRLTAPASSDCYPSVAAKRSPTSDINQLSGALKNKSSHAPDPSTNYSDLLINDIVANSTDALAVLFQELQSLPSQTRSLQVSSAREPYRSEVEKGSQTSRSDRYASSQAGSANIDNTQSRSHQTRSLSVGMDKAAEDRSQIASASLCILQEKSLNNQQYLKTMTNKCSSTSNNQDPNPDDADSNKEQRRKEEEEEDQEEQLRLGTTQIRRKKKTSEKRT